MQNAPSELSDVASPAQSRIRSRLNRLRSEACIPYFSTGFAQDLSYRHASRTRVTGILALSGGALPLCRGFANKPCVPTCSVLVWIFQPKNWNKVGFDSALCPRRLAAVFKMLYLMPNRIAIQTKPTFGRVLGPSLARRIPCFHPIHWWHPNLRGISFSRLLKKATEGLLMRAVQNRDCVLEGAYRVATVRESIARGLFQQPVGQFGLPINSGSEKVFQKCLTTNFRFNTAPRVGIAQ